MDKQHLYIRVLMHRAFVVFLAVFLISDVGTVYAERNLKIIAQQEGSSQTDVTRAEAERLMEEGLQLFEKGTAESLLAARKKFEAALVLWRKLGDKERQASTVSSIRQVYSRLEEKQKAPKFYNLVLPSFSVVFEEKQKAPQFYNLVLPSFSVVGNRVIIGQPRWSSQQNATRAEADKLTVEGVYLYEQGTAESLLAARKKWEAALILWQQLGDRKWQAVMLTGIGRVYDSLGEKQKALQFLNQALPLFRRLADSGGEATTLNSIGLVYSDLGEKQKALQFFNQALTLRRALKDSGGEAITLNDIGVVYNDLGEKQKALQFYNQALPLIRALRDKGGEAATLNNIGIVYNDLGEKQKALQFYEQALPLYRAVGDKSREATTLNNIGAVYWDLGEKQKALQFYDQALPLRRAVRDKGGEAITLNNIGAVYSDLGERQKALQFFNQALPLYRAVEDKRVEAATLNNIGAVYKDLGEKQKALQFYNQALPILRMVGDRGGEATTLGNLAILEREQGNFQTSLKHIQSAIAKIEELRGTYTNQDLKTTYFSTVQGYYKFYIDLLMDLHKKNPSKKYDALALHISERSRARSLIELLAQANAKISKNVDPKLIAQEKELQLKRQAQEKKLSTLVNQTPEPKDKIKQTEAEIQNIINQQKQLKVKIRAQNPERDEIKNPEPLKLPQIQQQLDKNTILLQYSLGRERSHLWLVTPTSLTSYELPKDEEIEKISKQFYKSLSRNGFSINSAQALSKIILAPVKDKLAGKRLVIVADGILQQIPFAALHDLTYQPKSNKNLKQSQKDSSCTNSGGLRICQDNNSLNKQNDYQPLFVNHEIVNLPSASTIAIQREKIAKRQIAPKKIAILADPVYSSNEKQVKSQETRSLELELERSALERSAKSLNRQRWKRLPGTASEAKAILKLVSSKSSLSAFRFDANYNWATSKNLNQYQILHFATHGFVNPDQPELSGIVLSLVNKKGQQIPGHLRLADLFEQDYPAELIVLSACETGLGKNVSGEGLVGLTRGLMYAGGARVALSLWQVSDEGTSKLMQEFYNQMLQKNKTPSEALRAAQRNLWSNPEWRSPYYWAAFTLQGEWK